MTVDWVESYAAPDTPVGAPGTVDGVARFEESDALPVPARFVAVTVTVYWVPLARPVIVQDVRVVATQVLPPGVAVAV